MQFFDSQSVFTAFRLFPALIYTLHCNICTIPELSVFPNSAVFIPFFYFFNNLFMRHLNVPQGIIFPNLTDIFQIEILTDYWFRHCLPHLFLNIQIINFLILTFPISSAIFSVTEPATPLVSPSATRRDFYL